MPADLVRSVVVLSLLVLALPASASAATKQQTVPGTVVFAYAQRPGDAGNCSAVVFVQWADVAGTTSATANYVYRGTPKTKVLAPPFNDTFEWVATYTVPPGSHWIQLETPSWRDGPIPSTCEDMSVKQREVYGTEATVELTVEIDPKVCANARAKLAARKKAVSTVNGQLRKATTKRAKKQLRAKLDRAKGKRNAARKRVAKVC